MANKLKYKVKGERKRVISNKGDYEKVNYVGRLNKSGEIQLVESGVTDMQGYINSFADSVDINILLSKYANGDTSALNQRQGDYLDVTQFPTTYAELLNTLNAGKEMFENLPNEIRGKFDYDVNKFISSIGTNEWYDKLALEQPQNAPESILEPTGVAEAKDVKEVTTVNEQKRRKQICY